MRIDSTFFIALFACGCDSSNANTQDAGTPPADTGTVGEGGDTSVSDGDAPSTGGIAQIAARGNFTCVALKDGTVKCWGDDMFGQSGVATTGGPGPCGGAVSADCVTKAQVIGDLAGVKSLALGNTHACALKNDGTVACWGGGHNGQLGQAVATTCATSTIGTVPCSIKAMAVPGLTAVSELWSGGENSCAKASDGVVRCWGRNASSQLGIATTDKCDSAAGSIACAKTPTEIPWLKDAALIAIGDAHICGFVGGGVKCVGQGTDGQLGDGLKKDSKTPVSVDGLSPNVVELVAGTNTVCALWTGTAASTVECWGDNFAKQISSGGGTVVVKPAEHHACGETKDCDVFAGGTQVVVRFDGDKIDAAGGNGDGQLGDGTTTDSASTKPSGVSGKNASFALGALHTCALLDGGTLMCWGSNAYGQLGDGTREGKTKPITITP